MKQKESANPEYSIVVPVYGTAASLPEISRRVGEVFENEIEATYELIFVNDGSPNPETKTALDKCLENSSAVRVITLMKNFGQQAATLCGLRIAVGQTIITMDDDLQHSPEEIPRLLELKDHDCVIASFPIKKHGLVKQAFSNLKRWFDTLIFNKPKHIQLTAFRILKRQVVEGLLRIRSPYPMIASYLFQVTDDVVNVPVPHHDRYDGSTTYTFRKMLSLFSNLLINNSSLMLKVIARIGFTTAFLSIAYAATLIIRYWTYGNTIAGWTTVIVVNLIIGGIVLVSIGILGEYLIRIINTSEHRPLYVIRSKDGY